MTRIAPLFVLVAAIPALVAAAPAAKDDSSLVDRAGDTGFIELKAEGFDDLTPKQKELAYWLTQASIALDPVIYDQRSKWGLRQKRLLEEIYVRPAGIEPKLKEKLVVFTKRFWANHGNHLDSSAQKFVPDFTPAELQAAAQRALKNGGFKEGYGELGPIADAAALDKELGELKASLFDAEFEPMSTAKNPKDGADILSASSNNLYSGVTMKDLEGFKEENGLNSRLVKGADGKLVEQVYRAGTPDGKVAPGLYAPFLKKAAEFLRKAAAAAEPGQRKTLLPLARYYETGSIADWREHVVAWVQDDSPVDYSHGFVETYLDARSVKGAAQGYVTVPDHKLAPLMKKAAQNAQYFEDNAPWDPAYRKPGVKPPAAKAVETVIETADFGVGTVGENLPNENDIHEQYGTKSFLFTESSRSLSKAAGHRALEEFAASKDEVESGKRYDDEAEELLIAFHEIIGHGSGKLKVKGDPSDYLKETYSALEEARADLMGLWYVWDPKIKEMGLVGDDQEKVAREMYYAAARAPLVQLRKTDKGDTLEEDHQIDRQLILNYIIDVAGGAEWGKCGEKTCVKINDFAKMRVGAGKLLAELMRIKAEGDYKAARALMDKYAIRFDPKVRDEVKKRYAALKLPDYYAGVYPRLDAKLGPDGAVLSVEKTSPRDVAGERLSWAAMFAPGLAKR